MLCKSSFPAFCGPLPQGVLVDRLHRNRTCFAIWEYQFGSWYTVLMGKPFISKRLGLNSAWQSPWMAVTPSSITKDLSPLCYFMSWGRNTGTLAWIDLSQHRTGSFCFVLFYKIACKHRLSGQIQQQNTCLLQFSLNWINILLWYQGSLFSSLRYTETRTALIRALSTHVNTLSLQIASFCCFSFLTG